MTKQLNSIYQHEKGASVVNVKSPQELTLHQHASHTALLLIRELNQGDRRGEIRNKRQTERWRQKDGEKKLTFLWHIRAFDITEDSGGVKKKHYVTQGLRK